jgi:endonuclease I
MNELIKRIYQYRFVLLNIEILSIIAFFYSLIFRHNSWWWIILLILPLGLVLSYIYHRELEGYNPISALLRYSLIWSIYLLSFFIILNIFYSSMWWLSFFVPIILLLITLSIKTSYKVENRVKRIIATCSSTIFIISFCSFTIPSYYANNHKNPKNEFSKSYLAVQSYSLYSSIGEIDTEHVIAQSWFKNDKNYVNDYVNVIKANKYANNSRGNLMFCDVSPTNNNAIIDNNVIVGYKNSNCFMPKEEYKGDIARILLYMYVTYKDDGFPTDKINVNLIKKWSKLDPVDKIEKERNNEIYNKYQYNNKLVSNPWLIDFIV